MCKGDAYHAGEIAVQARTGERALAQRRQTMISDRLPNGADVFLRRQSVAASVGAAGMDGSVWASLWCGTAGFLRSDEEGERVAVAVPLEGFQQDPVRPIVRAETPLALLVIDFISRQRLRINGTITRVSRLGLELRVGEAFGNCIKYIQQRQRADHHPERPDVPVEHGGALDTARRRFIARADTGFVASIHSERGLDVSHRGGHPGFARVVDDRTVRIPDYPGNAMYQTLGNFEADPRAGMALIDFEGRRMLSLTGRAVAAFGADDPDHSSAGTGRYWSFTIERWVEFSLPSTMTWTLLERSRFNPLSTGDA